MNSKAVSLTLPSLALQVSRPITLKKDAIQTRNRKLALKARRKGQFEGGSPSGGMEDFFKPFDSRFGYGATSSASAASNYLPGTGYYGQMHAAAQYHPSMASMASNLGSGFGHAAAAGFSLSTAAPNPMMAGATA